jgi:hypothetical protein
MNCPICSSDQHSYPTTHAELRDCHARLRLIVEGLRVQVTAAKKDLKILHTALLEQGWKGEL